jgi:hypothetical protein
MVKGERMEEGTDLNDVQHRRELAGQRHFMFPPEQFPKESIHHHHLSTRKNETSGVTRLVPPSRAKLI